MLSHPSYPGRHATLADAVDRLTRFRASGHHSYWPDSVSLCEPSGVDFAHVRGHAQITDVYLLSLAIDHGGALAAFDRRIALAGVSAAQPHNLLLIAG